LLVDIPDKYLDIFEAPKQLPIPKQSTSSTNGSSSGPVKCYCGIEAVERVTKKEGPNNGRKFYSCVRRQCNFFQWTDQQQKKVYMIKQEPSISNTRMQQINRNNVVKKEKTTNNISSYSMSVHKSNPANISTSENVVNNSIHQSAKSTIQKASSTLQIVKKEPKSQERNTNHIVKREIKSEPVTQENFVIIDSEEEEETSPKKRRFETSTSQHPQIKKKRKQFLEEI
jgi:hypothetical protein